MHALTDEPFVLHDPMGADPHTRASLYPVTALCAQLPSGLFWIFLPSPAPTLYPTQRCDMWIRLARFAACVSSALSDTGLLSDPAHPSPPPFRTYFPVTFRTIVLRTSSFVFCTHVHVSCVCFVALVRCGGCLVVRPRCAVFRSSIGLCCTCLGKTLPTIGLVAPRCP